MYELDKITTKLLNFNDMQEHYKQESDRGAAILASSHLDAFIGECLKWILVDDSYVEETLFKTDRPLSSFSSRINISFALGLITKEVRNNLNLIRKIRNHFAHHPSETSFNTPVVKSYCDNFSITERLGDNVQNLARDHSDLRERFLFVVGLSALAFHAATRTEKRRTLLGEET